jgi:hypothetical protein
LEEEFFGKDSDYQDAKHALEDKQREANEKKFNKAEGDAAKTLAKFNELFAIE